MKRLDCALVSCVLLQGAVAVSEEAPAAAQGAVATAHRHLGFFLRLDTGPGGAFASEPYNGATATLSGGAWDFGFSIGGALGEDNILAGHLYSVATFNPSISHSVNSALSNPNSVYYLSGVGPEFTHYFMPLNLYLSGAVLITDAILNNSQTTTSGNVTTTESTTLSSGAGVGLKFDVGKEWWVGDHWGLGIALHYAISWNHDSGGVLGSGGTLTTNALTADFCATYN